MASETRLAIYQPPVFSSLQQYQERRENLLDEVYKRSFRGQQADLRLRPIVSKEGIMMGSTPRPKIGPGVPQPYSGTCNELIAQTNGVVDRAIGDLDYNCLVPFSKVLQQIEEGKSFVEAEIDATDETYQTTCVGFCHALLKQLKQDHGIEGMFAVTRRINQESFRHAGVIIQCKDGYVFFDPIRARCAFPILFNQTQMYGSGGLPIAEFSAKGPGEMIPISFNWMWGEQEQVECYINIKNADELILKPYLMNCPFESAGDDNPPAICIVAYTRPVGACNKLIFISLLQSTITFKNLNIEEPERTVSVSFEEALDDSFYLKLKQLYDAEGSEFHVPLDDMHRQIVGFVRRAGIVNEIFHDIYFKLPRIEE